MRRRLHACDSCCVIRAACPRYVFQYGGSLRTYVADDNKDKVWKPEELLAYVFDTEPLFAAGKGWAYSDTNFIVVGMILEKGIGDDLLRVRPREHFLDATRAQATPCHQTGARSPASSQGYCGA